MTTATRRPIERGSALILVVLLLLAMTLTSVAVVQLSSQGRANAAAQSGHDALVECANAAQAQLWAAVATNGKSYYLDAGTAPMTVASIRLRDGKELLSPAHIDSIAPVLTSAGIRTTPAGDPSGSSGDSDSTNTFKAFRSGKGFATWVTARCIDSVGRAHEVEFAFRFSI